MPSARRGENIAETTDAGSWAWGYSDQRGVRSVPTADGVVDYVDAAHAQTSPVHMRLEDDVLAMLDELVAAFAESGGRESRSNVVRRLINLEHARLMAQREGK